MASSSIPQLHVRTPLVKSAQLSRCVGGRPVLMKMENTQPSGSFKLRGIGYSCKLAVAAGATHLICSSGGNAGMATAYSAQQLGVRATIFTMNGLPQPVLKKFSDLGSEIYIGGPIWDECDRTARAYIKELEVQGEKVHYIHPFDADPVWEGHSTMIDEMKEQMMEANYSEPAVVVTCVGGGGLLAGISRGMARAGWDHIPIVAMETHGAESFHLAMGAGQPVKLPAVTSIAKTLGAQMVCQKVVSEGQRRRIVSELTDDKTAVECSWYFLRDHQMLVEPACGATLSAVYSGKVLEHAKGDGPIVVVICGGATVDIDTLRGLVNDLGVDTTLDKSYPLEKMSK